MAPLVDPDAPPGFVREGFMAAETRRRCDEASAALDRFVYAVEDRHGAKVGALARAYLQPLLDYLKAQH